MAKDKNIIVYSLRLNMEIPQHRKIHEILKDLNPDIYKSKNRFLVNAVEMYIDSFEKEDLTKQGSRKKAHNQEYVSRTELELWKEQIRYELLTEVRNEVIRMLGGVVAGMHFGGGVQVTERREEMEESPEADGTIEKLAMDWSWEGEETT
jgi:hypothetical protein